MKQTDTVSSVQFQNCHAAVSDINKDCSMHESYLEIKYTMLNKLKISSGLKKSSAALK